MKCIKSLLVFGSLLGVLRADDSITTEARRTKLTQRVEILQATIIKQVEFNETPLTECLKTISKECEATSGLAFGSIFKNITSAEMPKVTIKATSIPVKELMVHIANLAGVSIYFTPEGCVVERKR